MGEKPRKQNTINLNRNLVWRLFPAFTKSPDPTDDLDAYQKRVLFLAQVLEYSSQPFSFVSAKGEILDYNQAFLELVGYAPEELGQINWAQDLTPPEWREVQNRYLVELQHTGVPVRFEKEYLAKDGRRIAVELLVHQFYDEENDQRYYFSFITDISKRKQAEEALQRNEQRYREILESIEDGYFEVDIKGNFTFFNSILAKALGYSKQDLLNMNYNQFMDRENARKVFQAFNRVYRTREAMREVDWHITLHDGSVLCSEASISCIVDQDGQVTGFRGIVRDISQRKLAEEALRQSELKYRLVFENTPLGIIHFDGQGRITACNDSLADLIGLTHREAAIGFSLLSIPDVAFAKAIKQALNGQNAYYQGNYESPISGKSIPVEAQIAPVMSDDGSPLGGVIIVSDITERKRYEETIRHLAYHDALTGLPNRLLIHDRISVALPQARRQNQMLALVYLDLDNFKIINDTLGHLIGDRLLQEVAHRLKYLIREGDTVARMGGDEFMFLFPGINETGNVKIIANKILDSFSLPFQVDGHEIHVSASIGISLYPSDGQDVETLIKNADTALYRAKEQGRNNYQLFTPAMNEAFMERMTLAKDLRHALDHGELDLHYQPLIDIKSGRIVGMEALVRWNHPIKGLVLPGKFIPVAEETGLIIPLEKWVLRTACRQNKQWQQAGLPPVRVAVNLSGRHFWQQDVVETVASILHESGLDPKYLELEITESVAIRNTERVGRVLQELRNLGIKIALDDFGIGYSSLSYLRNLPLDSLKIDQSFIRELGEEVAGFAIPQAVISLAKTLDLQVTAEGVEKVEQVTALSNLQCDQIQGYLICKPQPAQYIAHLLARTQGSIPCGDDGILQF